MKYQELHTMRLRLKALSIEDAEEILLLRSNLIVNQFVERQQAKTIDDALQFINRIIDNVSKNSTYYWCITEMEGSKTIGTICLWNFSKELNKAEVGYDLHPNFHGKGIMSEALQAVLEFGFQSLNLNYIDAYTQYDNLSSVHLLKKYGFQRDFKRKDEDNRKNHVYVLKNSG